MGFLEAKRRARLHRSTRVVLEKSIDRLVKKLNDTRAMLAAQLERERAEHAAERYDRSVGEGPREGAGGHG